jgi:5-methylcytosine-specific restriction endonuclease McrA
MARSKLTAPWNEHLADFDPEHCMAREGMKSTLARAERAAGPHGEFLARRGLLDPERVEAERKVVERIRAKMAERKGKKAARGYTPPLRERVYERDGYRCVGCGSQRDLTLDHWVPRSKGGRHTYENLRTMCRPCNHAKGDKLPDESNDPLEDVGRPRIGILVAT